MNRRSKCVAMAMGATALLLAGSAGIDRGNIAAGVQAARAEADTARPLRHFQVPLPAGLSGAQAQQMYDRILDQMAQGYGLSKLAPATAYRKWRRYNATPYRSETHGKRYVNNYANRRAKAYGKYERSGVMSPGSILAKDSFAATTEGGITSGPLFLMEKMAPGFDADTGDWRYTMVMPDGSVFGITNGEGSERVRFCADCHNIADASHDHMYYVPLNFRRAIPDSARQSD